MSERAGNRPQQDARERKGEGAGRSRTARSVKRDARLEEALREIEQNGGDGTLRLAADVSLAVRNLDKVYFPKIGRTKGDVLRFYVRAAPQLLPLVADRPLILKRYPDGVDAPPFFQHEPPDDTPPGVRVQRIPMANGERARRLIGGGMTTLLYAAQLGAIDVNPWHSRVESIDAPDYVIFDLDPGERARFTGVIDVALRLREILEEREAPAAVKTSGSRGLHVYVPLRTGTSYGVALAWATEVAESLESLAPRLATTKRALNQRPADAVYVDVLQNMAGKSVAAPFSLRARPLGTISMPLSWQELEGGDIEPQAFTLDVSSREIDARARVWRAAMRRKVKLG